MRSAMRAASQLPGRGAHCCGYGPYTCTLIKNLMMMMNDDDIYIYNIGYGSTIYVAGQCRAVGSRAPDS